MSMHSLSVTDDEIDLMTKYPLPASAVPTSIDFVSGSDTSIFVTFLANNGKTLERGLYGLNVNLSVKETNEIEDISSNMFPIVQPSRLDSEKVSIDV